MTFFQVLPFGLLESTAFRAPKVLKVGVLFLSEDDMLVSSYELFAGAMGTPLVCGAGKKGQQHSLSPTSMVHTL